MPCFEIGEEYALILAQPLGAPDPEPLASPEASATLTTRCVQFTDPHERRLFALSLLELTEPYRKETR